MTTLKFKTKTKSVPVVLEDENDMEITYQVHQLTGDTADDLRAAQAAKVTIDGEGNIKEIKDYTGQWTELVSRCLRDASGKLVPRETLNKWPDETLKGLYDVAADLNGMGQTKEATDPKN